MGYVRPVLLALLIILQTNQVRAADEPLSEEQLRGKAAQDLAAAKKQIKAKKYDYAVYFLKEALEAATHTQSLEPVVHGMDTRASPREDRTCL